MSCVYDEDYYEHGVEKGVSGYQNYRWMPELTIPMCHEIVTQVGIKKSDTILDFGCAKGYLVKGFRCLHHEAYGVDISPYAVNRAPEDVRPYLQVLEPGQSLKAAFKGQGFDVVVAKDVLEHVPYEQLQPLLTDLKSVTRQKLFAIVPLGANGKYVIPEYENDVTHVIRESLGWWKEQFERAGFTVLFSSYKMPHIKQNWEHHDKGNGFFVVG